MCFPSSAIKKKKKKKKKKRSMSVIFCQRVRPGSLCFPTKTYYGHRSLISQVYIPKTKLSPLHIMDNTFKTLCEEFILILLVSIDPPLDLALPTLIEKVFTLQRQIFFIRRTLNHPGQSLFLL